MKKIKISICGSAATRGCFHLNSLKDCDNLLEITSLQYLSSFISIMSPPVVDGFSYNENISNWNKTIMEREFNKIYLTDLLKEKPDCIVIDCIMDALYGVMKLENTYITNNKSKLMNVKISKDTEPFNVIKKSKEYMDEFSIKINDFIKYINEKLPNTAIIVHSARLVSSYYDNDGNARPFNRYDFIEKNQILERMEEVIKGDNVYFININNKKYYSTENHIWKKGIIHYETRYYDDFILSFHNIIFKNIISGSDGEVYNE